MYYEALTIDDHAPPVVEFWTEPRGFSEAIFDGDGTNKPNSIIGITGKPIKESDWTKALAACLANTTPLHVTVSYAAPIAKHELPELLAIEPLDDEESFDDYDYTFPRPTNILRRLVVGTKLKPLRYRIPPHTVPE